MAVSTGTKLGAIGAGGALAMNSGSGNMYVCGTTDQSFYCQLTRFTGSVQMIITLIIIFLAIMFLLFFAYKYMTSKKGKK